MTLVLNQKIWVDKGSEINDRLMKSWLQDNDIEIYLTHIEVKSIAAERFIRTSKNKIFKSITSRSKSVYIDKLEEIVHKYNNTHHRTIKMKPIDVKSSIYIDSDVQNSYKGHKFDFGDHVRISKYKNILAKHYTPYWSEQVLVIKKVKNIASWTYVIGDLNGEKIIRAFYEKELQKANQIEVGVEKVIKKKGDKSYVNWEGCYNSFNSWINLKRYRYIKWVTIQNQINIVETKKKQFN